MISAPASAIFCRWSAASSKAQPLATLCATAGASPAASSSDREARKTFCGVRKIPISLPALRVPRPGAMRRASQCMISSSEREDVALDGEKAGCICILWWTAAGILIQGFSNNY